MMVCTLAEEHSQILGHKLSLQTSLLLLPEDLSLSGSNLRFALEHSVNFLPLTDLSQENNLVHIHDELFQIVRPLIL